MGGEWRAGVAVSSSPAWFIRLPFSGAPGGAAPPLAAAPPKAGRGAKGQGPTSGRSVGDGWGMNGPSDEPRSLSRPLTSAIQPPDDSVIRPRLPAATAVWFRETLCFRRFSRIRVMGIEPTPQAWEAHVLPLNYTRDAALPAREFVQRQLQNAQKELRNARPSSRADEKISRKGLPLRGKSGHLGA